MIYRATKKITGGKLVKVKIDADSQINAINITGDFFLHPEESITEIENSLKGMPLEASAPEFSNKIQETLTARKAAFIGVSPQDIAETIKEALQSTS